MSRNKRFLSKALAAAAVLGLSAYGVAFADDSSMSMWTGDSYAFFNNLDNSPGHFNMARAPRMMNDVAHASRNMDDVTAKEAAKGGMSDARNRLFERRPSHGMATNPFRNDTGA